MSKSPLNLGQFLLSAVFTAAIFAFLSPSILNHSLFTTYHLPFAAHAANVTGILTVPGEGQFISSIVVNSGSNITLIANATKTVQVSFVLSDPAGCANVFSSGTVTSTLYRSGAGTSTQANNLSRYIVGTSSLTYSCVGTSTVGYATSTFNLWYFADATDASSSYSGQTWNAFIEVLGGNGSSTSAVGTGVVLNTLVALNTASTSISYGTVGAGADTGAANQQMELYNVGNASITISISGTALINGGNSIPTSSQRFSSGTFTYGSGGVPLSDTPQSAISFPIFSGPPYAYKPWATTTPLPYTDISHTSLVYNGFIYTIGGNANGSATSTVIYAPINSNGTLGAWATTTPLPYTDISHTSLVYNGFIYTIGGNANGSATSTVIYAPINSNGTLGAWATTTPLPYTDVYHTSLIYNGFIYIIGGDANGFSTSTVIYAPLPARSTFWGVGVPGGTPAGDYLGTVTMTAVYSP